MSGYRVATMIIGIAITVPAFLAGAQMGQAVGIEKAAQAYLFGGIIINPNSV